MEQLSFKVAEVEGPLDLILQLIVKHKLNIYDIEITRLLEQYMEYIQLWQEQDMDIASEFLDMASRLVYIKSVSLLPKHDELEEQLKKELTGQLIEYSVCKQVAELLKKKYIGGDLFTHPPVEILEEREYQRQHKPEELLQAYLAAVGKVRNMPINRETFQPLVAKRIVPVGSKIILIMRKLYQNREAEFLSLFEGSADRADIVATFLAVLELVKGRRIYIEEDGRKVRIQDVIPEDEIESLPNEMNLTSEEAPLLSKELLETMSQFPEEEIELSKADVVPGGSTENKED